MISRGVNHKLYILLLFIILVLTFVPFALSVSWNHSESGIIQINEGELHTYDFNTTQNESLIVFSLAYAGSLVTTTNISSTGFFSSQFGVHFLGKTLSSLYPSGGNILVTAENGTDEFDYVTSALRFNITNVNGAPTIERCNPSVWDYEGTDNDPDYRYWDCDTTNSITNNITEGDTATFNVTFRNFDPTPWNETTLNWYKQVNGGALTAVTCGGGTGTTIEQFTDTYFTGADYFFENCTVLFDDEDAGVYSLIVFANDTTDMSLGEFAKWDFSVNNTNQVPYFTANTTDPVDTGLYLGQPLIQINEGETLQLNISYTDGDIGGSPTYEEFDVSAYWYKNGTELQTEINPLNYADSLSHVIPFTDVVGLNESAIFNFTVIIDDTANSTSTMWYVNVTNVNQPPNITQRYISETLLSVATTNLTIREGDSNSINFTYDDIDGDINATRLYRNGSLLLSQDGPIFTGVLDYQDATWNYSSAGSYNISFFVNDSLGQSFVQNVNLTVLNNTAPVVTLFTVKNGSGGTDFYEGGELNVTFTYTDDRSDNDDILVKLNDTILSDVENVAGFSVSKFLNYTSAGDYNVSLSIEDAEPLFGFSSTLITIFPVELFPYFNTIWVLNETTNTTSQAVPYASNGVVQSREGQLIAFGLIASDQNGNETIVKTNISISNLSEYYESLNSQTLDTGRFLLNYTSSGYHQVNVSVEDEEGNINTTFFYLNITNNTAPNITAFTIRNSTNGVNFTEGDIFNFSFSFEDSFGSDDLLDWQIFIDGPSDTTLSSSNVTKVGYNLSYLFNLTQTSFGSYNITASVTDKGQESDSYSISLNVLSELVKPNVTDIYITEANGTMHPISKTGDTLAVEEVNAAIGLNNLTFSFQATDDDGDLNTSSAQVTINGTSYPAPFNGTHYEYVMDLNFTAQGDYNITVDIYDDALQKNTDFDQLILTVTDNILPTIVNISILASKSGATLLENDSINFVIDARDDNSNLKNYTFTFNDTNVFPNTSSSSNNHSQGVTFGDAGFYNITATAFDTQGLNASFSRSFEIIHQNRSPDISYFHIDGTNVKGGGNPGAKPEAIPIVFEVNATDFDSDITDIEILVDDVLENVSCAASNAPIYSIVHTCSWTPPQNANGLRNISVNVSDAGGLWSTYVYQLTISPNSEPVIDVFNVTRLGVFNTSFIEGDTLSTYFTYSDANLNIDTVMMSLNTTGGTTLVYDDNMTYVFNFSERGVYLLTATVNDTFGEVATANYTINVSPKEFTPQFDQMQFTLANGTIIPITPGVNSTHVVKQNNGDELNNATIYFIASDLNDNTTLTNYTLDLDGVFTNTSFLGTVTKYGLYLWNIDYTKIGNYSANVTLYDETGLYNTTVFTFSVTNNTAPLIILNSSLDQSSSEIIDENDTLYINLSTYDLDDNLDTVSIYFEESLQNSSTSLSNITWSYYFNYTQAGTYNITYVVNDTAGEEDRFTEFITVNATELAPNITLLTVDVDAVDSGYTIGDSNITLRENQTLFFNFTTFDENYDIDTLLLRRDGTPVQTITSGNELTWTWVTDYNDDGTYTFVAWVNDSQANEYNVTFDVIIINNTLPQVATFDLLIGSQIIDNTSVRADEGETLIVNISVQDINNSFNNLHNVTVKINGTLACQNTSTNIAELSCQPTWVIGYTYANNTQQDYLIELYAYDEEGLELYTNQTVTIFHTAVAPVITSANVKVSSYNDSTTTAVSTGASISLNETQIFFYNFTASDVNGIDTILNVSYRLTYTNGTQVDETNESFTGMNSYTWVTDYTDVGTYNFNVTVTDLDGLTNITLLNITVVNNTLPQVATFTLVNQVATNCEIPGNCAEGDNITLFIDIFDTDANIRNTSLFIDSVPMTSCVTTTNTTLNCSFMWETNFTNRGVHNITFETYDSEPILTNTTKTINLSATEVPPTIDTIIITSQNQNKTFNISWVDNLTNVSGVYVLKNSANITIHELDVLNISFTASDLNDDVLTLPRIQLFTDGAAPSILIVNKQYEQTNYELLASLREDDVYDDGYSLEFRVRDSTDLWTYVYLDLDIINNTAPNITLLNVTNSTGGNSSFMEGDLLNITFAYEDFNNNTDTAKLYVNGMLYAFANNTAIYNLDNSSYGAYDICVNVTDTEPLETESCQSITVTPVNISPSLIEYIVDNGTPVNITGGESITIQEGTYLNFTINATDGNGNETLVYNISRNGTTSPTTIGTTNQTNWLLNYSQEGTYNVTLDITTDRENELVQRSFTLTVINNTAPVITFYNITSNASNISQRNFEEGQSLFLNYTFVDNQDNVDVYMISVEKEGGALISNNTLFWDYTIPIFAGNDLGNTVNYTVTFFVNDTQGLEHQIVENISVLPKPEAPIIQNAKIVVDNETEYTVTNGSYYTIFESQSAILSFDVIDVNNDVELVQIWNSTSLVSNSTSTSINSTFTTNFSTATSSYTNFSLFYYVNDSFSLFENLTFQIQVKNNTAPLITANEIQDSMLDGNPLDNNSHSFEVTFTDPESNYDSINISLYSEEVGIYTLINQSIIPYTSSPASLDHFFALGERGDYRVIYTVNDTENLNDTVMDDFIVVGNGAPPYIENISINSTYFGFSNVTDDEVFLSQEGDVIQINFSAYDIDDGDYIYSMEILLDEIQAPVADGFSISTLAYNWTTNYSDAGLHTFKLIATDGTGAETINKIYINVTDNVAPSIDSFIITNATGDPTTNFLEGSLINLTAIVSDPNLYDDFDTYLMLQNGSTISSSLVTDFSWNYSSEGIYNMTFFVNDSQGLSNQSTQIVTVGTVEFAPVIQSVEYRINGGSWESVNQSDIVNINENIPFSVRFNATDGNEDDTLIYNGTRNGTVLIGDEDGYSWTPSFSANGSWTINVSVEDDGGLQDDLTFTLVVINNTAPVIDNYYYKNESGNLTTIIFENQSIELYFHATDDQGNIDTCYLYFRSNSYPCSGAYEVNRTSFFTFTQTGNFTVTYFVNDTEGRSHVIVENITVLSSPARPLFDVARAYANSTTHLLYTGANINVYENENISLFFNATDANEDIEFLNITGAGLAANETHNPVVANASLASNWTTTFTDEGEYPINISVTDATGLTSFIYFNVTVLNNTAPIITSYYNSTGSEVVYENETIVIGFTYTDVESNANSSTEEVCYDGTCYPGTSKSISLGFTDRGTHNISYLVADEEGLLLNHTYNISVQKSNQAPVIDDLYVFDLGDPTIFNVVNIAPSGTFYLNTTENAKIGFDIDASDLNGDELTYNITINSTPVTFNDSSEYTWNIGFNQDGINQVDITVSDGTNSTNYTLYVNVTENTAPTITNLTFLNSTGGSYLRENDSVTVKVLANDIDANINNLVLYQNGTQVKIASSSPLAFIWITDFNDRGTYNFSVNVSDVGGAWDFDFNDTVYVNPVEHAPVIDLFTLDKLGNITPIIDTGIHSVDSNVLVVFDASASDPNAAYSTIDSYVLVKNGTIVATNSSGSSLFSYTPSISDPDINFSLIVNDTTGLNTTINFTIRVGANTAPNLTAMYITDFTGGNITENDTIGITFDMIDIEGDVNIVNITYDGVQIASQNDSNYTIPFADVGEHNITIYVEDFDQNNDSISQNITVEIFNVAPTIVSAIVTVEGENPNFVNNSDILSAAEGDEINFIFTAEDLNGNGTISGYNITRNGTVINQSSTGEWIVNYTSAGLWNVTFFVTDGEFNDTLNITINVSDNVAPVITNFSFVNGLDETNDFVGRETIYLNFTASDVDDDTLTYAIYWDNVSTIISSTNVDTYLLPDLVEGEHSFVFIVYDAEGLNDTEIGTFNTTARNIAPTITLLTVNDSVSGVTTHSKNGNVTILESSDVELSFTANDVNNDVLTYSMKILNSSNVSDVEAIVFDNELVWNTTYDLNGTYVLSVSASDGPLATTANFTLWVMNNTAPLITTNTTLNSTGGITYSEGDLLNVTFNYTNTENDLTNITVLFDSTPLNTTGMFNVTNALFDLNYTTRGAHTVNITVIDGEGLSDFLSIPVWINITNVSPIIVPLVQINTIDVTPLEGNETNISANANITVSFEAIDYNGQSEINFTNITLDNITYANTTRVNFAQNTHAYVNHTVTYSVTSIYGEVVTFTYYLNETASVAPVIQWVNFTNQTSGSSFAQGEQVNFTSLVTDSNNDVAFYYVYSNKTGNDTLLYNLSSMNETVTVPADYLGSLNLTYVVIDTDAQNDTYSFTINITPENIAPAILTPLIDTQNITEGSSLIYDYSGTSATFSFVGSDVNGNDTINVTGVVFTLFNGTIISNYTNSTNMSYVFSVGTALVGKEMDVSYYITDTASLRSEHNFSVTLRKAQVETITKTTSSSGGSSGGSSSPPPQKIPKVDIVPLKPIELNPNEEIVRTITIRNTGESALTNVSILPEWLMEGVGVEILDEYNDTLGLNESITVRVRVTNGASSEGYNVSFSVQGNVGRSTKVLRDSAVLYVNTLGEDEDDDSRDYKELHLFLTNLLKDDISCLELVDFLVDAEKMFSEGQVTGAIELLNEAKIRCLESSHKSFDVLESVILHEDTGLKNLILQILGVLIFFILVVPPIFIYFRHRRGAKKVDKKEEQIEEWLDEFYK